MDWNVIVCLWAVSALSRSQWKRGNLSWEGHHRQRAGNILHNVESIPSSTNLNWPLKPYLWQKNFPNLPQPSELMQGPPYLCSTISFLAVWLSSLRGWTGHTPGGGQATSGPTWLAISCLSSSIYWASLQTVELFPSRVGFCPEKERGMYGRITFLLSSLAWEGPQGAREAVW